MSNCTKAGSIWKLGQDKCGRTSEILNAIRGVIGRRVETRGAKRIAVQMRLAATLANMLLAGVNFAHLGGQETTGE